MESLLVVDAAPLIYAVFNSVGHLASKSGEKTGLRYGFVRGVRSYQERTKSDKVVIAFDSPGPIAKAVHLPNYKSNRVFTDAKAEMYSQVPALREMLDLTQWTQVEAPGYEADDLIGAIARAKGQRGHRVTIASADNDLLQLVNDNVHVFRSGSSRKKTKDRIFHNRDVYDTYGVHPEYLCLYRAVTGDTSDNLPGVLTRGDAKRELQHLLHTQGRRAKPFTPRELLELLKKVPPSSALYSLGTDQNLIATVYDHFEAMSLPTPPNIQIRKGRRDRQGLADLFRRLEFTSMEKYLDQLTGTSAATTRELESA